MVTCKHLLEFPESDHALKCVFAAHIPMCSYFKEAILDVQEKNDTIFDSILFTKPELELLLCWGCLRTPPLKVRGTQRGRGAPCPACGGPTQALWWGRRLGFLGALRGRGVVPGHLPARGSHSFLQDGPLQAQSQRPLRS